MNTRFLVATVTLCLLALASGSQAQYLYLFPGPIPDGNSFVNSTQMTATPLGPGRPDGVTIPSRLTIGPAPNNCVSIQLTYNRVIVSAPYSPPQAVLAISPGVPSSQIAGWSNPYNLFNPPEWVSVFPNIENPLNIFTHWQTTVSTQGTVSDTVQAIVQSLVPNATIPASLIGSQIVFTLQGFFAFPQPPGSPWSVYATCGWRVQF